MMMLYWYLIQAPQSSLFNLISTAFSPVLAPVYTYSTYTVRYLIQAPQSSLLNLISTAFSPVLAPVYTA